MSKLVLVLNGPPGVGKDTIAEALAGWGFAVASFKDPMFRIASAVSGVPEKMFRARHNNRALKEKPWSLLGGLSTRQFLIRISEEWVKPTFGPDHFGLLANEAIKEVMHTDLIVFSDGGFIEEFNALHHQKVIVRLHAPWASFEDSGDSRGYIHPDAPSLDLHLVEDELDAAVDSINEFLEELS